LCSLVLHVSVCPNPQGTCLGSRTASSLAITLEFSCFGRCNFRTPPEAGTPAMAVSSCSGNSDRKTYAQSQLQRNVMCLQCHHHRFAPLKRAPGSRGLVRRRALKQPASRSTTTRLIPCVVRCHLTLLTFHTHLSVTPRPTSDRV